MEAAARREVLEECGVEVDLRGLVGVVDRILRDTAGRIQYHYVLVDFWGTPRGGESRAGSDALEVRWVPLTELSTLELTEGLELMVEQAVTLYRRTGVDHGGAK
jgi:ADP-ribose pyrophosphatase YjhB (NUDIX family)